MLINRITYKEYFGQTGGKLVLAQHSKNKSPPVLQIHDPNGGLSHIEFEIDSQTTSGICEKLREFAETSNKMISRINPVRIASECGGEIIVSYGTAGEPFRDGPCIRAHDRIKNTYDAEVMLVVSDARIIADILEGHL